MNKGRYPSKYAHEEPRTGIAPSNTLFSISSEWHLAEQRNAVPDLLPTQENNASHLRTHWGAAASPSVIQQMLYPPETDFLLLIVLNKGIAKHRRTGRLRSFQSNSHVGKFLRHQSTFYHRYWFQLRFHFHQVGFKCNHLIDVLVRPRSLVEVALRAQCVHDSL